MAHLATADTWAERDRLAVQLQEELPDEYAVIADCLVGDQPLDTVVVGPNGLIVLHCKGWEGVVRPARRGDWRERVGGGREIRHRNPADESTAATKALKAFLQDEFAGLDPAIHHLLVLTKDSASLEGVEATDPLAVATSTVAQAIAMLTAPPKRRLPDQELRATLARALDERRLTASQRAKEPFLFSSGGLLRGGRKVWTVRDAVRHMDKNPDAGVQHLYDGSLVAWLSEQGAEHIARIARDTVRHSQLDQQDGLEQFLIDSGLVQRPSLAIRPRRANLGHVLAGDTAICRLRIRKGRRRGRLYGTLITSDRWLEVKPERFSGTPVVITVSGDAAALTAGRGNLRGQVLVHSSASEEPLAVPAVMKVVGVPSRVSRALLRPAIGLLSAGLLGSGLGFAVARWGLPAPEWLTGLTTPPLSTVNVWVSLLGLLWGLGGWVRGRRQPMAWPTGYALGRWLLRLLCWAVSIAAVALAGHWTWESLATADQTSLLDARGISVVLFAAATAIFPSVLGETRYGQRQIADPAKERWRTVSRPLFLALLGILLAASVVAGGHYVGTAWERLDVQRRVATTQEWVVAQWNGFDRTVQGVVDRLYLWYYDRRAPANPTPSPEAVPTPPSDAES